MVPNEPSQLGEYRLLERLGQGGMAMVYRAERTGEAGFKKKVAIKRMLPQYRRDPSLLERFAAEARTNARLDHPNLVAVVDFGIDPEPYLVMEFVEGVTLALLLQRLVEKGQRLEIAAACFVGAEAAAGIDHAHRKRDEQGNPLGIVHRDVSPQNILLSNEGAVKVSDFGLVKAADNVVQTGSGIPIGKMSYMAPEQAEHHEVDARADVFSLGIVIWEMLTLRTLMPPNDPMRAAQMLRECAFEPPSTHHPEVPPELDAIVMACLHPDPKQRTPSAQAVGMQLRELLHELAPGYGRDQLARLLGWVFPERGWTIDEPHETAAQPSLEERLSIPQVSAAEVMQRVSHVPPEPAAPAPIVATTPTAPTAPNTSSSGSGLLWILALGVLGLAFLVVTIAVVLVVFTSTRAADDDALDTSAPLSPPMAPVPGAPEPVMGTTIEANVPDARVFLGARDLGVAPVRLTQPELNGDPIVVLAPGHQPAFIAPDELSALITGGQPVQRLSLLPDAAPDQVAYVRHPRPAIARLAFSRELLGTVPGVVLVPATALGGRAMVDVIEGEQVAVRMPTSHCDATAVCLLDTADAPSGPAPRGSVSVPEGPRHGGVAREW